MMYYDYFLNIDVSVYQSTSKEQALIEVMAVRLDLLKKILAIIFYEKERFRDIEPEVEDIIDK
jgi:hypothetical protein